MTEIINASHGFILTVDPDMLADGGVIFTSTRTAGTAMYELVETEKGSEEWELYQIERSTGRRMHDLDGFDSDVVPIERATAAVLKEERRVATLRTRYWRTHPFPEVV